MSQDSLLLELHFPSQAEQLQHVRRQVSEVLQQQCCHTGEIDCAVLAINEACMNIIQHAYGGDGSGRIILKIFDSGEELVFLLIDFATPVEEHKIRPRDLDEIRPGGLGVHFIREMMDECRFLECPDGIGNIFQMRKRKSKDKGC